MEASREERHLKVALLLGAALFAVEAAIYVPEVFRGNPDTAPYAINSTAKDVLFCALTLAAALDLRRRGRLVGLVVGGHVVIVTLLALALVTGNTHFSFPPPSWLTDLIPATDPGDPWRLVSWLISATAATAVLAWLNHRALKAVHGLEYLWPIEHATLTAMADATLDEPRMPPEEIATAIDHYWHGLDIGYKGRLRLALLLVLLWPLRHFKPPFSLMDREARRRFLHDHWLKDTSDRAEDPQVRGAASSSYRFATQLVYVGYYGDERSYPETGYERFSKRPRFPGFPAAGDGLRVQRRPPSRRPDVIVVGSGAGGSVAAHGLADRGLDVLMVERGRHVDRADFTEDERVQYGSLYSDGALQLSRDFSFQMLQGMCVGGGTVVNNAICFEMPDEVLTRWNGELGAGLDPARVDASFEAVRELIGARRQPDGIPPSNPTIKRLANGFEPVDANLHDCLGSGYCNIGCRYGKKLSMLDRVLPETQRACDRRREQEPDFRGRLEVLSDAEVTKLATENGRVTGVQAALRLPEGRREQIEIRADRVVLAAGAVHSSRILMESGLGGDHVGEHLCANVGSHMTADWPDGEPPLRAFDGLQMSHYLPHEPDAEYMVETWFNPLMSQALIMPGWLDQHQRNMRRYDHLGCLGVIAPSDRDGHNVLRKRNALNGAEIDFTPSRAEIERLCAGLRRAGEILLEAGAERVFPATWDYREFHSPDELDELRPGRWIRDASDINVNTAHPQGGNRISRDAAKGVVDEHCRLHGHDNVWVCDASVFPTAVGVNPQLTVMAMSHYAATRIA